MSPKIPTKALQQSHDMEKMVQWPSKGTPRTPVQNYMGTYWTGLKKKTQYAKIGPRIPQNAPLKRGTWCEKIFSISDNQGYAKNACTEFHDKILNMYWTCTFAKIIKIVMIAVLSNLQYANP